MSATGTDGFAAAISKAFGSPDPERPWGSARPEYTQRDPADVTAPPGDETAAKAGKEG